MQEGSQPWEGHEQDKSKAAGKIRQGVLTQCRKSSCQNSQDQAGHKPSEVGQNICSWGKSKQDRKSTRLNSSH